MCKQRKTILRLITIILLYLVFSMTTLTVKAEESNDTNETTEVIPEVQTDTPEIQVIEPQKAGSIYELSPDIITYCQEAAKEFSISEFILEALIYTESRGYSDAKNGSYVGLTQLKPKYFEDVMTLLNITDPTNPRDNVRICAYKLSQWSTKYDNMYLILECWHKGESKAVAQFKSEGTNYSRTICTNATLLETQAILASNPQTTNTDEDIIPPIVHTNA